VDPNVLNDVRLMLPDDTRSIGIPSHEGRRDANKTQPLATARHRFVRWLPLLVLRGTRGTSCIMMIETMYYRANLRRHGMARGCRIRITFRI